MPCVKFWWGVFSVPIGEIAARSLHCTDKDPVVTAEEADQLTSRRMGIAYDRMLVGLEYPYFFKLEER